MPDGLTIVKVLSGPTGPTGPSGLIAAGVAFPSGPVNGQLFHHTGYRADFQWVTAEGVWRQASVPSWSGAYPASPPLNLVVHRIDLFDLYMWNGSAWVLNSTENFGIVRSLGASAGFNAFDRSAPQTAYATFYRSGASVLLANSEGRTVWSYDNTNDLFVTRGEMRHTMPATTQRGLGVFNIAAATAEIARFDGSAVTNGQVSIVDKNGHLATSQAAVPTQTLGTGAGTTPTNTGVKGGGADQAGCIQFTTGTAPAAAASLVTLVFRTAYTTTPAAIVIQPANAAAKNLWDVGAAPYADEAYVGNTGFTIISGTVALLASTAYKFWYHVL